MTDRIVVTVRESPRATEALPAFLIRDDASKPGYVIPVPATDSSPARRGLSSSFPRSRWVPPTVSDDAAVALAVSSLVCDSVARLNRALVVAYGGSTDSWVSLCRSVGSAVLSSVGDRRDVSVAVFEVTGAATVRNLIRGTSVASVDIGRSRTNGESVRTSDEISATAKKAIESRKEPSHVAVLFNVGGDTVTGIACLHCSAREEKPPKTASSAGKANVHVSNVLSVLRDASEGNAMTKLRDSVLTDLLMPCLRGGARIAVLCTVDNVQDRMAQAKAVLQFASEAQKCSIKAGAAAPSEADFAPSMAPITATPKRQREEPPNEATAEEAELSAKRRHKESEIEPVTTTGDDTDGTSGKDEKIRQLEQALQVAKADVIEAKKRCEELDEQRCLLLRRSTEARDDHRKTLAAWKEAVRNDVSECTALLRSLIAHSHDSRIDRALEHLAHIDDHTAKLASGL